MLALHYDALKCMFVKITIFQEGRTESEHLACEIVKSLKTRISTYTQGEGYGPKKSFIVRSNVNGIKSFTRGTT